MEIINRAPAVVHAAAGEPDWGRKLVRALERMRPHSHKSSCQTAPRVEGDFLSRAFLERRDW